MIAIINTYNKKRYCAIRKKNSKKWLIKPKNRDSFFFTEGKMPTFRFNSPREAKNYVSDQWILMMRNDSNRWNYRTNPDGIDYSIEWTNEKEFTLFCYDIDKLIEYEIIIL